MALLLALAGTLGAMALGAAASEQLVYWPLITDGKEYRRVSYPQETGSLLVLADREVVIEARRAPVSYWPITREYLADLSKHPPPISGSVEIVDGSGAVTVAEPESFVVWHPLGVGAGPAELVHGERAVRFYEGYLQAARAAAEEEREYQRILGAHQAAVEAWIRMAAERRGQNMPAPPPELEIEKPEPFHAFATEPRQAAVVSLLEGTYTVRVRGPDGKIVPGSERELISFAPLGRAVGYVLRPEDRWTRPTMSFAPDEAIYTTGRTDLFFQTVPVVEYDALCTPVPPAVGRGRGFVFDRLDPSGGACVGERRRRARAMGRGRDARRPAPQALSGAAACRNLARIRDRGVRDRGGRARAGFSRRARAQ
jgi:hypothetical protein